MSVIESTRSRLATPRVNYNFNMHNVVHTTVQLLTAARCCPFSMCVMNTSSTARPFEFEKGKEEIQEKNGG